MSCGVCTKTGFHPQEGVGEGRVEGYYIVAILKAQDLQPVPSSRPGWELGAGEGNHR